MRRMPRSVFLGVTFVAFGLAACGKDSGPSASLTNQQAAEIGGAIASQVTTVAASFTATGLQTSPFLAPAFARSVGGARLAPPRVSGPCPVIDDLTDADGDGVLDNATITFDPVDCAGPGYVVSGSVHVTDPSTSDASVVGYNATYTNLATDLTGQNNDHINVSLNGSHGVLGTATSATLSENLTLAIDAQSGTEMLNGTFSQIWQVAFTPDPSNTLVMDGPLPDGQLVVNGTTHWQVNGENFTFSILAQSPLAYDATCEGQDFPFTSGELRANLQGSNGSAYIRIQFQGCGVTPLVQYFGSNA